MEKMLKEFLGIGGYMREAEGFMSWQHLTFVSALMLCMTAMAVLAARRTRGKDMRAHNRVLMIAALVMDSVELIKITLMCTLGGDPMAWLNALPLYLCSIQFITLPVAAFARGRVKEAAIDFVCMFGLLGAVLGTYCAGNNYACYPVISLDNVVSGITHSAAGFAALYIMMTGIAGMKKRNMWIAYVIMLVFCVAAYGVNLVLGTNYMFLMRGDGTPYDILYNLVSGSRILYPLGVMALFAVYIALAYGAAAYVRRHRTCYVHVTEC